MTPRDNGKNWEREVAKDLGGNRTGPTGKNSVDVDYPHVGIECKYQSKLSLRSDDLAQARKNAADAGYTNWALLLKRRGGRDKLAVIEYDYLLELLEAKYGRV